MPVTGIQAYGEPRTDPADLVIRNAKIHTGDVTRSGASCTAIRGETFVAVGDEHDILPYVGPNTRIVDALGRRVIPGLNDSHMHVIRTGLHFILELRWDGVRSLTDALGMLAEQAGRTPEGQWVCVVGGWSSDQFAEQRIPTIAELNAAAPDTPVIVTHLYQAALLNRAALRAVGYTSDTPDPPGGEFVRDHAGYPTGLLIAAPSAMIIYSTLAKRPGLDDDQQLLSTRYLLRELNRFGLTSALDAAGGFQSFPENYRSVMQLAHQGDLSLRIGYYLFPQVPGQELDDIRRWMDVVKPGDGDGWLRCVGAGESLAWSLNDFENFTEPRPELPPHAADELEAGARLLLANGWGFRLHATYDETIRADLDVFERIAADGAWPEGTRWLFDHAETVSPHSLDRILALGGAVGVQHRMHYQGAAFLARYGPQMTAVAPPMSEMRRRGILVGAGTDAPRVSSYNPWVSLSWLVTGRTIGGAQLYPEENRVSREDALNMYTTAGAEFSGEAEAKGTISVGKYADLAILSADFLSVNDQKIADIESLLTVVGGNIVHSAGDYENLASPLPEIPTAWSPFAHYGGYHRESKGVEQAVGLTDAVADSREQQIWREAKGHLDPAGEVAHSGHGGCA